MPKKIKYNNHFLSEASSFLFLKIDLMHTSFTGFGAVWQERQDSKNISQTDVPEDGTDLDTAGVGGGWGVRVPSDKYPKDTAWTLIKPGRGGNK